MSEPQTMTLRRTLDYIKSDSTAAGYDKNGPLSVFFHLISSPGFLAVFLYRFSFYFNAKRSKFARGFAKAFVRSNQFINSCEINCNAVIGRGLYLPHPFGIVVGKHTSIGEHCVLYQNVTLGMRHSSTIDFADGYPTIGNGIKIFAGAAICGPISIGDGAVVGANSVITRDLPAGCTAVGIPGKIVVR